MEAYDALTTRMRARIAATEKADAVTQGLLIEVTAELEKEYWMFQAENRN
jgi:starvation-inducible DNA-binding protein